MNKYLILVFALILSINTNGKESKATKKNRKIVAKEDRQFEKNFKKNPGSAIPFLDHANKLATINSETGRAQTYYIEALKRDSANARIYKDYGEYLFDKLRSVKEAKKMLDANVKLAPGDEEVNKYLASINNILAGQDAENLLKDFGTTNLRCLNPDTNFAPLIRFDSLKKLTLIPGNPYNYQSLLTRFLANDQFLTPAEMYMMIIGYSAQPVYNPFNYNDIFEMKMMANHNLDTAIKRGNELTLTNPLNPALNKEMMYYYRKENDSVHAEIFLNRIRKFFSGVLFSGTGTCEKPYISLWGKEEYNFITYLGCKYTENHSMGTCTGGMAEAIEMINPATQKSEMIHFDVALIYMQAVGK